MILVVLWPQTMKIVSDIQFKEYLTSKELTKVKDQQEKRRTIKAIRFVLSSGFQLFRSK